jgi:hypothetical protein
VAACRSERASSKYSAPFDPCRRGRSSSIARRLVHAHSLQPQRSGLRAVVMRGVAGEGPRM